MEIYPMKLVRRQGLKKIMAETGPDLTAQAYTLEDVSPSEWYDDVVHYLLTQRCPNHLNPVQRRALHLKSDSFMLKGVVLYKRNHEGVYLRCLGREKYERMMSEFHDRYGTGHGSTPSTTNQILRAGYY